MAYLSSLAAVEVELADARPRLGQELRVLAHGDAAVVDVLGAAVLRRGRGRIEGLVLVGADEREQRLLGLLVLAHLAETEAEEIVGRVEEAVVRELGQQALVERDRRRVVDLGGGVSGGLGPSMAFL